jgi:hypothetical protein
VSNNPLPIRSALDAVQLDFPSYEIRVQKVWDKVFYTAEAKRSGVQPVSVQAESIDRLRIKLRSPIRPFNSVEDPSVPRIYDYLLGGKDNFEADREQARRLVKVFPSVGRLARESRQFQRRAVRYAASRGVTQFIDLGCGLPTKPNTHETAQEVQPDALTVYVDNDEIVLSHAQNILAKSKNVLAVAGDLGYPDEILYDSQVRELVDFFQPMCVVSTMTLHFCDVQAARKIMTQVIDRIPHGSYVVISVGQLEGESGEEFTRAYDAARLHHHSQDEVASFLEGLEPVGARVGEAYKWRAPLASLDGSRRGHIWAAVGRKTSRL